MNFDKIRQPVLMPDWDYDEQVAHDRALRMDAEFDKQKYDDDVIARYREAVWEAGGIPGGVPGFPGPSGHPGSHPGTDIPIIPSTLKPPPRPGETAGNYAIRKYKYDKANQLWSLSWQSGWKHRIGIILLGIIFFLGVSGVVIIVGESTKALWSWL